MALKNTRPGLLTTTEAAEYLGRSARTLAKWRLRRVGPPFVRYNERVVLYPIEYLGKFRDTKAEIVDPEGLVAPGVTVGDLENGGPDVRIVEIRAALDPEPDPAPDVAPDPAPDVAPDVVPNTNT